MAGLLDLLGARNPKQSRGLLSELLMPMQNRVAGLINDPAQFMAVALREGLGADDMERRWTWDQNRLDAVTGSPDTRASVDDAANRAAMNLALMAVVKNPTMETAAKKHFGTTYAPSETGYLLDDATRLDLSGRHYATGYQKTPTGFKPFQGKPDYLRGSRNVDHRELGELVGGDSGWERLSGFMDQTGAVRYMPDVGISMVSTNKPSLNQIEKAVTDFRRSGLPLNVDIDAFGSGSSIASKEFNRPTAEAVYKWIESQYAKIK